MTEQTSQAMGSQDRTCPASELLLTHSPGKNNLPLEARASWEIKNKIIFIPRCCLTGRYHGFFGGYIQVIQVIKPLLVHHMYQYDEIFSCHKTCIFYIMLLFQRSTFNKKTICYMYCIRNEGRFSSFWSVLAVPEPIIRNSMRQLTNTNG